MGKQWKQWRTLFSWASKSLQMVTATILGRNALTNLDSVLTKKQRLDFAYKGPYNQSYGFSSSHVQIWVLDNKKGWAPKNWCFWTVVLDKTLESPLESKEIQPINPKRNQSWIFIGRTDAESETPILCPPDAKNWVIGNDPGAGKDWRWEEKGTTENEMPGWHHRLNGYEFEQALGVGDGQWGLVCCSPQGPKESDTTERVNRTEHFFPGLFIGVIYFEPYFEYTLYNKSSFF